jgi:hypothetical protein
MQIVALDGAKLLALMLAGGVFALAGLWLMFRPQPAGEAARIELFGMKVQASSAGLLVFLIGAVFLAVPIFVPEKPISLAPSVAANDAPRANVQAPPFRATASEPATQVEEAAFDVHAGAFIDEREPNNAVTEANRLELGQTMRGHVRPDDIDWFVVPTEGVEAESIRVIFRHLGNSGCPVVSVQNAVERLIYRSQVCSYELSSSRTVPIDGPHVFVRVHPNGSTTPYEVVVNAE